MAWTDPSTWVSGAILTAAQLNTQLRDNMLAGGPIYTTAAARDAAITAPFEGQRAYLSAPAAATVTATGATTAVPTGVETMYNGSAWVCTTPVGAYSNTSATTTSTSYVTTLTGDATAISVTLTTGTTALVMLWASANASVASSLGACVSVSGATTIAAADTAGCLATVSATNYWVTPCRTYVITGLTAGANTFTLNYKTSAGTSSWGGRALTVQGVA